MSVLDGLLGDQFVPGGDLAGSSSSQVVVGINGATAPAKPTSYDVGKAIVATAPGVYSLQTLAVNVQKGPGISATTSPDGITTVALDPTSNVNPSSLVRPTLGPSRAGFFEYETRLSFPLSRTVAATAAIPESEWGGDGDTDTYYYHQQAVVEVEVVGCNASFEDYRLKWQGILRKGTIADFSTWAISQGLVENTALRVPSAFNPATNGACNVSMTLGGTHNGTIFFSFLATGTADARAGVVAKIRIFGGGQYT